MVVISLVPRPSSDEGLVYTVSACALIYTNSIYFCNLSVYLLQRVTYSIGDLRRSMSFEDCVSNALHRLGMSHISLKKEQRASIEAIYTGRNVFMWLPTGYGKSICYQALPFIMDCKRDVLCSLVIVVSPLLALMIDQVTSLRARSVQCSIMTLSSSSDRIPAIMQATAMSLLQTDSPLFCTPEALVESKCRKMQMNEGALF